MLDTTGKESQMQIVWRNRRDETGSCAECPGCDAPYPLGGVGDEDADVMLIAMEPAYNLDEMYVDIDMPWERAKERLLIERKASDNPLWQHMANVALAARCKPADLYFTNLAKCTTDDSSFDERYSHCETYLPGELAQVDPELILLHGGNVISRVFQLFGEPEPSSVGSVHGDVVETASTMLMPLYHWGYAYRQRSVDEYNELVHRRVDEVLHG